MATQQALLSMDGMATLRSALFSQADPDDIGSIDMEMISLIAPLFDSFAKIYFRMEIEGMEKVPKGPALIVGNHNAGITFMEPFGVCAKWYLERGLDDPLYFLAHDTMVTLPLLSNFLIRGGCVRASQENATKLLAHGNKVMVFPGGNLEAFRPFWKRHQITFGGKKGFIKLALRQQVPIVPNLYVGGHETFFVIWDGQILSKLLGLRKLLRSETCPIFFGLPWGLGVGPIFHIPLPVKSKVRFLDPISLDEYSPQDANNPEALEEIYQKVTTVMQKGMAELASSRKYPILG